MPRKVSEFIPVYEPYFSNYEEQLVRKCMESGWVSSRGEFIARFESKFAEYIGAHYATSVSNGSVALHLALEALGVGAGDEVIVPTFTYIASVNAIAQTGATPVFVDSSEHDWQISLSEIEKALTAQTKAIMAVHLYGFAADLRELRRICNANNLFLIEDCAEAFGTRVRGRHVGTYGDVATFSFFGNKTITTGEGGMVVSRNKRVHMRCAMLKNQGVSANKRYWHEARGFNYRMTNIQAAIGIAQLSKANQILAKKKRIARWYWDGLQGLPLKVLDHSASFIEPSYWMHTIAVANPTLRESLMKFLEGRGVETRPAFYPAHLMPPYKEHKDKSLPGAESISLRGLNLPSSPLLKRGQVDFICRAVTEFFAAK